MKASRAIEVLEAYLDKTDLDRRFDEEICQAFDEAFETLEEKAEEE